jgi:hypothetical protein
LSHEAIHGIPVSDQWKLLSIFIAQHKSVIEEMPAFCNKWFPTVLGGAGMAIPTNMTIKDLTKSYDPRQLLQQQKQAAYLACNPLARMKRVCRSRQVVGEVGELLNETLALSNSQVPMRLGPKPLNREQKTMLGGKTLLGYLIRGLGATSSKSIGGELRKESVDKESMARGLHRKEVHYLNQKYNNWLKKSSRTSLHPMEIEKIAGYQEHLALFSYLELVREHATLRAIDVCRYRTITEADLN